VVDVLCAGAMRMGTVIVVMSVHSNPSGLPAG
jgi:hypothetical protein